MRSAQVNWEHQQQRRQRNKTGWGGGGVGGSQKRKQIKQLFGFIPSRPLHFYEARLRNVTV